jgi:tetratricopeptide (TPR) repeat protein
MMDSQPVKWSFVCAAVMTVLLFGNIATAADAICGSVEPMDCSTYVKKVDEKPGKTPRAPGAMTPGARHYAKGREFYKQGKYHEALKALDQAIALDAKHESAHVLRGVALTSTGKPDQGIAAIDRGIALATSAGMYRAWFAWPRLHKGAALMQLERPEQAIAEFNKAIKSDPDAAAAYGLRAEAYLTRFAVNQEEREEDAKLAASDLEQALKLDPKESRYWATKAKVHFILGEKRLGCDATMRACEHGDCRLAKEFTECR